METGSVEAYNHQRLAELKAETDMRRLRLQGRLSFGMEAYKYEHLPSWESLATRKKQMVKLLWVNAAFVSLTIVGMIGNYFDRLSQNWIAALATWLTVSALIMLFVVVAYYSMFYEFRMVEREIRKVIYEDFLTRIKKEEKNYV